MRCSCMGNACFCACFLIQLETYAAAAFSLRPYGECMIFAITFSIDFDMVSYESYIQPRTFVVRMHGAAVFSQSEFCCGPMGEEHNCKDFFFVARPKFCWPYYGVARTFSKLQ